MVTHSLHLQRYDSFDRRFDSAGEQYAGIRCKVGVKARINFSPIVGVRDKCGDFRKPIGNLLIDRHLTKQYVERNPNSCLYHILIRSRGANCIFKL